MSTRAFRCCLRFLGSAGAVAILLTGRSTGDDQGLRQEAMTHFAEIPVAQYERRGAPDVTLGRALFWDQRISADGKTACGSCHLPEDHGADRRRFSLDARGKQTKRNSQTVLNATQQPSLRWTGNRKTAAEQAEKSLVGSMGFATPEAAVQRLQELGYEAAFRKAYPNDTTPVSTGNYGRAIEAYEKTLMTPSAFDRFLSGDNSAMSDPQKRGMQMFMEIGCTNCHSGPLLGGNTLEMFGVVKDYWTATGSENIDLGRFEDTKQDDDKYVFRVSMLRNVARTGPYFHDGSVSDLEKAVQIMADVQLGNSLTDEQAKSIVEFLKALTGDVPEHFSRPELPDQAGNSEAAAPQP